MTSIAEQIIPRLSADERRVMSKPTVQLAMLEGAKGIVVERADKVPGSTIKSLRARCVAAGGVDPKSRIMLLTSLGESINKVLVDG